MAAEGSGVVHGLRRPSPIATRQCSAHCEAMTEPIISAKIKKIRPTMLPQR